jgi:hypothetical protein
VIIALEDDPATAVDESHYVQLARFEQEAIDGKGIDLYKEFGLAATPTRATSMPTRSTTTRSR